MWGKGISTKLVRMDQFTHNLGLVLCDSTGAKVSTPATRKSYKYCIVQSTSSMHFTMSVCIYSVHCCFNIAPLCECDQRISTTFFKLHNPIALRSLRVMTPSPHTPYPMAPPPYQYGGRGLVRGGVGGPTLTPHG